MHTIYLAVGPSDPVRKHHNVMENNDEIEHLNDTLKGLPIENNFYFRKPNIQILEVWFTDANVPGNDEMCWHCT